MGNTNMKNSARGIICSHIRQQNINLGYLPQLWQDLWPTGQSKSTSVAAIRFTELELGYPDNFGNMPALCLLLWGIKRVKGVNQHLPMLPITTTVLKDLKTSLRHSNFHVQDQYMLWAALIYSSILWISQVC